MAGLLVAAVVGAASSYGARPDVLVQSGPITAFAQDADTIAWVHRARRASCETLSARALRARLTRSWDVCFQGFFSYVPIGYGFPALAVSGRRLLWLTASSGNAVDGNVWTATLGRPKPIDLGGFGFLAGGRYVTGMAGDGGALAFSVVVAEQVSECVVDPVPCRYEITGSDLFDVVAGEANPVGGGPPAASISVADGSVALAEAASPYEESEFPRSGPGGAVEVRELAGGRLISRVSPAGTVKALALAGDRLAVLVEAEDGAKRIDVYGVPDSALLTSMPVSRDAEPLLDMAGQRIVYQVGRDVRLVDLESATDDLLWHAGRRPLGLSVEGRRVAWAQSGERTGRVVAVTLRPESPERVAPPRR